MKVCGVIAEFNPFHQGHAYLLEQARKQTGADAIVVVMSGNWVQRGEPAIEQKWSRAKVALQKRSRCCHRDADCGELPSNRPVCKRCS